MGCHWDLKQKAASETDKAANRGCTQVVGAPAYLVTKALDSSR